MSELILTRFVGAVSELVRWGEPWDIEDDDDDLVAAQPSDDRPSA